MSFIVAVLALLGILAAILKIRSRGLPPVVHYGTIPYLGTLLEIVKSPFALLRWAKQQVRISAKTTVIYKLYPSSMATLFVSAFLVLKKQ